jgi:hypothetical protein
MTILVRPPNRRVNPLMFFRPLSLVLLSSVIFLSGLDTAASAKLTKAVCEADYKDLMASIERNRLAGVEQINEHLVGVTDETERAKLIEMREKSWDEEEEQRAIASGIRRDCLAAVKK